MPKYAAIRLTHADEARSSASEASTSNLWSGRPKKVRTSSASVPASRHYGATSSAPRLSVLKSIGLMCAMCFASVAAGQDRYQITRIPTPQGANSVALGINNKDEVVGYSFQGDVYQGFLYSTSDQPITDVGSLGGKLTAACAVNDNGQVTGYSQDGNGNLLAFLFSRDRQIISLGALEGAATSEAFGINNHGVAVGDSQSGNQNHRPVSFSNGSVQDLGVGRSNELDALETAYAINDAGQIVGRYSAGNNAFHGFLLANGKITDLATLGGANSEALAINKKGQVVGNSDTADGRVHAFLFDHSQLQDLGTLPGYDNASFARGINSSGEIVGESDSNDQKRAVLFAKGQIVELDKVAENLSDAGFNSLDVAYGIDDQGVIVGYGTTSDNLTAAFVAVPAGGGNQPMAAGPPGLPGEENYNVFYTRLSSDQGSWVQAGNYGYCFRPRVSENWRPYRDGRWIWTDRGWYWDSNESFGWATNHYGRWVDVSGTGWCWVPGHQWAPAWVSWRQSDDYVGWAPLPPEADVSGQVGISSWSDAYYGIGPAAYTFINYSHWSEPSYARFVEPPERNVQIIAETKNVTNIVNNNNVINNYGPPVQTVAAKTNRNIQPVKLAFNPATDPNARYGQTLQGNQLKVVAPAATLKAAATKAPPVQNRIANPVVEKGWQGVPPAEAAKLQKTIAAQAPPPKNLPKPTPFAKPQIATQPQVAGPPRPVGSPGFVAGQKQTPPNLLKPAPGLGQKTPAANVTPTTALKAPAAAKKPLPPNLLVAKPGGTPGAPPTPAGGRPAPTAQKQLPTGAVPGPSPNVQKPTPPNLNVPKASPTPTRPQENRPAGGPTPKPASNLPPGQTTPQPAATPHAASPPAPEKKPETTPHPGPANPATPKPTPTPLQPANPEAPKSATTPRHTPANIGKPTPTPPHESTGQKGAKVSTASHHELAKTEKPASRQASTNVGNAAAHHQSTRPEAPKPSSNQHHAPANVSKAPPAVNRESKPSAPAPQHAPPAPQHAPAPVPQHAPAPAPQHAPPAPQHAPPAPQHAAPAPQHAPAPARKPEGGAHGKPSPTPKK